MSVREQDDNINDLESAENVSGHRRGNRSSVSTGRRMINPKSWKDSIFYILRGRTNVLLLFMIPALVLQNAHFGTVSHSHSVPVFKFICSFLAIIPMTHIMKTGIEDLSVYLGPAYQSLLHAFSGNFVELVIESIILMDRKYAIVRSTVLGSVLCNITLVLGVVFIVGSWPTKFRKRKRTKTMEEMKEETETRLHTKLDSETFVDTSSSILALAFLALLIPAAFKIVATPIDTDNHLVECNLQSISHATAIILILVYAALLLFQLKTHTSMSYDDTEVEHTEKKFNLLFDLFLIVVTVAGVTYCSKILVSGIEVIAEQFEVGTGFIGVVLLPLCVVSTFIEHYHAITEAADDKIDTAIGIVLNTSVQTVLLITPILVAVGWIFSRPLTLDFNMLEISVLGCAILIVNYLVADGKVHWLEGYMLIVSYLLISIAFFYLPYDLPEDDPPLTCDPWSRNFNKTRWVEE